MLLWNFLIFFFFLFRFFFPIIISVNRFGIDNTFRPIPRVPYLYSEPPRVGINQFDGRTDRIPFLISRSARRPADGRIVRHKGIKILFQFYFVIYVREYINNTTTSLLLSAYCTAAFYTVCQIVQRRRRTRRRAWCAKQSMKTRIKFVQKKKKVTLTNC